MADMLDYIRWRGDLPFTVSPPNEVDAVIFSTLSYIPFRGRAPGLDAGRADGKDHSRHAQL